MARSEGSKARDAIDRAIDDLADGKEPVIDKFCIICGLRVGTMVQFTGKYVVCLQCWEKYGDE